jgi:hypothetical protein
MLVMIQGSLQEEHGGEFSFGSLCLNPTGEGGAGHGLLLG